MIFWSVIFFILAIMAALFGFTGIAASAGLIAKVLFVVFLILFMISLVVPRYRRPT